MDRHELPVKDEDERRPSGEGAGSGRVQASPGTVEFTDREAQIRDEELCRMAAFRLKEAANRIATLGNSAQNPGLREQLLAVCKHLLALEQDMLDLSRAPHAPGAASSALAPEPGELAE